MKTKNKMKWVKHDTKKNHWTQSRKQTAIWQLHGRLYAEKCSVLFCFVIAFLRYARTLLVKLHMFDGVVDSHFSFSSTFYFLSACRDEATLLKNSYSHWNFVCFGLLIFGGGVRCGAVLCWILYGSCCLDFWTNGINGHQAYPTFVDTIQIHCSRTRSINEFVLGNRTKNTSNNNKKSVVTMLCIWEQQKKNNKT